MLADESVAFVGVHLRAAKSAREAFVREHNGGAGQRFADLAHFRGAGRNRTRHLRTENTCRPQTKPLSRTLIVTWICEVSGKSLSTDCGLLDAASRSVQWYTSGVVVAVFRFLFRGVLSLWRVRVWATGNVYGPVACEPRTD